MSILSAVLVLVLIRLSVLMDWSYVGIQHITLVKTQMDAGIVQLLILIPIQFQGCYSRYGLDLSGQTEEQQKLVQDSNPPPPPCPHQAACASVPLRQNMQHHHGAKKKLQSGRGPCSEGPNGMCQPVLVASPAL